MPVLRGLNARIAASIGTIFLFLSIGTVSYHFLEGWGFFTSFYFSVVTLTTVGYGDLYPTTELSRLFTAIFLLLGVSSVVASLGLVGEGLIHRRTEKVKRYRSHSKPRSDMQQP